MTALSNSNDTAITLEEWNGSSTFKLSKTFTIQASSSSVSFKRSGARFTHLWRRLLQALGFPSSVTANYVPFQIWDTLQGLSTYTRTMLSTQALLSAIGVGEKSATVIGATFQWFLRDLTGMLGGILFTFYQGSNLDNNAKMNANGPYFATVSVSFCDYCLLGSISRSFTGVASGATRAALTQHFALQDNVGDISAKHFMKTGQVLSPEQVSAKEHVLPLKLTVWSSKNADLLYTKVHLGTRVSSLDNMEIKEHLLSAASYYAKAKYLLVERNGTVNVIVHKDSNAADVLKSFVHALILATNVSESKSLHSDSQMWIDKHYDVFIHKLKSLGWKTERLLSPIIWRANWIYKASEKKAD
ncbi:hypothetical protein Ahy_A05g024158 isoform C [Arachis hypogaea]|uniref:Protein root UVB sensitive n=1 Tax=Arachis hypogaea TaxID=3818 RepID=A0A445D586_ARAHY|nr:hypothetical protein Ahy_A05g024158 isoform C [Arachis hypogaea]